MPKAKSPLPVAEGETHKKLSNINRILTLATWAKIVSWVLFGIGGIMVLLALVQLTDSIGGWFDPLEALLIVVLSLLPIFLGLVLQFLIEGIYLAVDSARKEVQNAKPK
jgi:hypothetical protein